MPLYEFEDAKGNIHEVYYPMAEAPQIGSVVGGLTRVVSQVQGRGRADVCFSSIQLPNNWPYAKRHAPDGAPVFTSMKEVREACARSQDTPHDAVRYD